MVQRNVVYYTRMAYRPRIPDNVDRRVDYYLAGKHQNKNQLYIEAIKTMYSKDGDRRIWIDLIQDYCEENDREVGEVLDNIIEQIFDDSANPDIKYKARLGL